MNKFAFAFLALLTLGFIAASAPKSAQAGNCWHAGNVTCCMTPEGVICH